MSSRWRPTRQPQACMLLHAADRRRPQALGPQRMTRARIASPYRLRRTCVANASQCCNQVVCFVRIPNMFSAITAFRGLAASLPALFPNFQVRLL